MKRLFVLIVAALVLGVIASPSGVTAAAGWRITSFSVVYAIDSEGTIEATETLSVDFGTLQKHGIFRYLDLKSECVAPRPGAQQASYECPIGSDRKYDYAIHGVTDATGHSLKYDVSDENLKKLIKIGDADKVVS
ncbi:MAG: DUF2207 domain-containing protein, partial [Anaerolineaceae bacterium]